MATELTLGNLTNDWERNISQEGWQYSTIGPNGPVTYTVHSLPQDIERNVYSLDKPIAGSVYISRTIKYPDNQITIDGSCVDYEIYSDIEDGLVEIRYFDGADPVTKLGGKDVADVLSSGFILNKCINILNAQIMYSVKTSIDPNAEYNDLHQSVRFNCTIDERSFYIEHIVSQTKVTFTIDPYSLAYANRDERLTLLRVCVLLFGNGMLYTLASQLDNGDIRES